MELYRLKKFNKEEVARKEQALEEAERRLFNMKLEVYSRMLHNEDKSIRQTGIEGLLKIKGQAAVILIARALMREEDMKLVELMLDAVEGCIENQPAKAWFGQLRSAPLPVDAKAEHIFGLVNNYPHTLAAAA